MNPVHQRAWEAGTAPIGLALHLLGPRHIREPQRHPGRFDLAGAVLSTVGTTLLVYGFIRTASFGRHDAGTFGAFALAILVLGTSWRWRYGRSNPSRRCGCCGWACGTHAHRAAAG